MPASKRIAKKRPRQPTVEQHKERAAKLRRKGQSAKAEDCYRQALALFPLDADIHNLLGNVLNEQNRLSEAISSYKSALSLHPRHAAAFNNLGQSLVRQGKHGEAINAYRIALQIEPNILRYQNLLLCLQFSDEFSQAQLAAEHVNFNRLFMAQFPRYRWNGRPDPGALKVRVGYVSGDFRQHSMAFFISQVLQRHDRERFHVSCYYNNALQDRTTLKLKSYAQSWTDCVSMDDEKLAKAIRRDKIDILVDLSGHTQLNRLGVFARAPAPVQITYLGYPNTTGLDAMNYQLVSETTTPPGMIDDWISERCLRLTDSYCCFDPLESPEPASELPAKRNGFLTLASFSRLDKVNATTFQMWCDTLKAVPDSRLLFYNNSFIDPVTLAEWRERFSRAGIDPRRLTLGYLPSIGRVFETYKTIDLVLDTYPYNGCTTTCQALLAGVPVVSLAGEMTAARVGLDMLRAVDLAHLAVFSADEFAPLVKSLAADPNYLQNLRTQLPARMRRSALMDGEGFTRNLEALYLSALA